jgi:hypothetical protein
MEYALLVLDKTEIGGMGNWKWCSRGEEEGGGVKFMESPAHGRKPNFWLWRKLS